MNQLPKQSLWGAAVAAHQVEGGHNKGGVASQLAVENIIELFNDKLIQNDTIKIEYIDDIIKQSYNTVNSMIYEKSKEDISYEGMGTTLTLAVLYQGTAYIANVGDSRCYLVNKEGKLEKITSDHSIVEEYVKANIITEEEARYLAAEWGKSFEELLEQLEEV